MNITRIDKTVDKIAHIADLHIRNLRRHVEYKQVFEKVYDNLKESLTDDSIIYLAGDIVHSKTEMSPELIAMVSELLNRLSDIATVIMILGNHDANLNNSSRLDALSPIVNNINSDRVIFLKETAVLAFNNCRFLHFGMLDKAAWDDLEYDTEVVNIGLFHGAIHNSETDSGYVVKNEFYDIADFNNCSVVLCGDIHRRQFLTRDDVDVIAAYAGSLIQQNHGEELGSHGYIMWEFKGDELVATEVDVDNEYGYYTLEIRDGVFDKSAIESIPESYRLRIKFFNTSDDDVSKIYSEITSTLKRDAIPVTRHNVNLKDKQEYTFDVDNVRSVEYQNNVIRDYLKTVLNVSNDTIIQSVIDLNTKTNEELSFGDVSNLSWELISFKFSNMFSYGEDNEISFENMNGVYGIFAPNASGKSSLFDALVFCLFDKCSRSFRATHILNTSKKGFTCSLKFKLDDVVYHIDKIGTLENDGHVKVTIDFYTVDAEGNQVSLNGDSRRGTSENIRKYIGSYDNFILTTISLQNQNSIFIDLKQSERKDILLQFMGIDLFDDLFKIASDRYKSIKALISDKEGRNYDNELDEYKSDLASAIGDRPSIVSKIDALKVIVEEYYAEIMELNKKTIPLDPNLDLSRSVPDLVADKTRIEGDLVDCVSGRDTIAGKIEAVDSELSKLTSEYDSIGSDYDSIKEGYDFYMETQNKLSIVNKELDAVEDKRLLLEDSINKHSKFKYDFDCDFCVHNSEVAQELTSSAKKNIEEAKDRNAKLLGLQAELVEYCDENSNIVQRYNAIVRLRDAISKQEKAKSSFELDASRNETKIVSLQNQITTIESRIKLIEDNMKNITFNKEIDASVSEVNTKLNSSKIELSTTESELTTLDNRTSSLKTSIAKLEKEIKEFGVLKEEKVIYDLYLECIKRDSIPYKLITDILPSIESKVNEILSQMVEFTVSLEADRNNISGFLSYSEGDRWPLEMASGMERFISGLAIRIALMDVYNLSKPDFLVVDEGFGSLDSDNIASLYMLFDYLKSKFKFIIVISHVDSMRDIVDGLIEIRKEDGNSKVTY